MSEHDENIREQIQDLQMDEQIEGGNLHFLIRKVNNVELRLIQIEQQLLQILAILGTTAPAMGGKIQQLGEIDMAITGTKVGGTSKFQVVWNGGMTPGAAVTWKSNDAGIVITPDPTDATGNTVNVTDAVLDANTSYTLDVSGTASDGSAVSATTATVPLLAAPATGGTINQLS